MGLGGWKNSRDRSCKDVQDFASCTGCGKGRACRQSGKPGKAACYRGEEDFGAGLTPSTQPGIAEEGAGRRVARPGRSGCAEHVVGRQV